MWSGFVGPFKSSPITVVTSLNTLSTDAEVVGYDPGKAASKLFTVKFKYDGDVHDKALKFVEEYLVGDPPENERDEEEAPTETTLALVVRSGNGSHSADPAAPLVRPRPRTNYR
ncbi:hypothetical protein CYMTET_3797 [Cymbomonas tetramitiformis]|uniref:Uncharacterized protein n=1 Tax=Cymbomonas tetramitiformis TaxID=36881 RepID=A0AAE0H2X1_9CHLO|nr:hypothetical protein CYMTET_3797 [Cymbomonas tetramitiformis]